MVLVVQFSEGVNDEVATRLEPLVLLKLAVQHEVDASLRQDVVTQLQGNPLDLVLQDCFVGVPLLLERISRWILLFHAFFDRGQILNLSR